MYQLHVAENLVKLRREKGVTQEALASFLNVTKASVSKWENGQSLPDILMLPQIATYFDVKIDDFLGYEPQLSNEQIQKIYQELAMEFASEPFEEVFAKSEKLVKKYYSCYPFVQQMIILWMNHIDMAEDQTRQREILEEMKRLCIHILESSNNTGLCSDVMVIKATLDLQSGEPEKVIDILGELLDPERLINQSDGLLLNAYHMIGDVAAVDSYVQMFMYNHLIGFISDSMQYMMLHMQEQEICGMTIQRIDQIIECYQIDKLHPNTSAIFNYQVAIIDCMQGRCDEAIERLKKFVKIVKSLVEKDLALHGDDYFTRVDEWFEKTAQGKQLPRDKELIVKNAKVNLENPVFEPLKVYEEFKQVRFE